MLGERRRADGEELPAHGRLQGRADGGEVPQGCPSRPAQPRRGTQRCAKAMRTEDFRKGDEAWIVVDVDTWGDDEFAELLSWAASDSRHHLAVSNPKFELFLVMHFERGNGCTTPQKVDAALKRHWPRYGKRVSATRFSLDEVKLAIEVARTKRTGCQDAIPAPGMTDAHLLVGRLIEGK